MPPSCLDEKEHSIIDSPGVILLDILWSFKEAKDPLLSSIDYNVNTELRLLHWHFEKVQQLAISTGIDLYVGIHS